MYRVLAAGVLLAAPAAQADPSSVPAASAPDPAAARPALGLMPLLLVDVPTLPPLSLRLEAVRVAGMRSDTDWRYPEPGPLLGIEYGAWFMGVGHYHPRTARSASLHGGSIAATMVGEILLGADSPLAAIGVLAAGATLDAAAADVDRDAESRRK